MEAKRHSAGVQEHDCVIDEELHAPLPIGVVKVVALEERQTAEFGEACIDNEGVFGGLLVSKPFQHTF